MNIFLTALLLFFIALAIHFIMWRTRLPKGQIKSLLLIFTAVLTVWLIGFARDLGEFAAVLHVALLYGSAALCYVITYSAIEADSPTLSLMRYLGEAQGVGRSRAEIAAFMALRPFVRARLSALERSGLIRQDGPRYVAVGTPPLSFRLILGFRKLYGPIAKGG